MDCVTPFSYVELLIQCIDFNKTMSDVEDLTLRVTDLLVTVVLGTFSITIRGFTCVSVCFRLSKSKCSAC